MPRYFFHLNTNEQASVDSDGLTFLDHQAAWEEATMACGEMIRTIDGHLQPGEGWQMEVTDEAGKLMNLRRRIRSPESPSVQGTITSRPAGSEK